MLTAAQRARFTVVLVGARNPQNIGAAARAMRDFGFGDLRVVNEFAPPFEAAQIEAAQLGASQLAVGQAETASSQAQECEPSPVKVMPLQAKSAVGAHDVMRGARRFDELTAAIADCTLVAGTTAIGGRGLTREVVTVQAATPGILTALAPENARVALLFGSEKTGLTNEQLSHCQLLLTIPLFDPAADSQAEGTRHLSMNLGQAVAVCLYELTREGFEQSRTLPALLADPATAADRERLKERLLEVMRATGYDRRFPANTREPIVRGLTQQLGATRDEAATWLGLLRHILRQAPEA